MKGYVRKYILIFLVICTALLCTVGASTWILLSEKRISAPTPFAPIATTVSGEISATAVYSGENTTVSGYTVTDGNGANLNKYFNVTVTYREEETEGSASTVDGIKVTANVSFEPTTNIYNAPDDTTVEVPLKAVAYTKSDLGYTYYSSIQGAITGVGNPTSLTDVVVVTGININVTKDITIPENVNLVLPFYDSLFTADFEDLYMTDTTPPYIAYDYGETYAYTIGRTEDGAIKTAIQQLHAKTDKGANIYDYTDGTSAKVQKYRKILITMTNKADITVEENGCLSLGGEYGMTSMKGRYAQINLDKGSSINVKGKFYCEGFVKEINAVHGNQTANQSKMDNSFDADRLIHVTSTGFLQTGLALYDMKSGGNLTSLIEKNIFAINKFDFPYLQTFVQIENGGKFHTFSHAFVSIAGTNQHVNKLAPILEPLASSETSIFYLLSENACFEYCPNNTEFTTATSKTRIFINGEIILGGMTLPVATYTLTTVGNYTPISHKFAIFINNGGSFTMDDKVKLLPGSSLKVNDGGSFNINSSFIAYKGEHCSYINGYGTGYDDAQLINNGTIKVGSSGNIGAYIQTTSGKDIAKLDFSDVKDEDLFSATSDETLSANTTTINKISIISQGQFIDESDKGVGDYQFPKESTIYSAGVDVNGEPTNAWYSDAKHAINKLNIEIKNVTNGVYKYTVYMADNEEGTIGKEELTPALSHDIDSRKYVIIEASRYQKATMNGEDLVSGKGYPMTKDNTLVITPSEGVSVKISTESKSGASSVSYQISESTESGGSDYTVVETIGPNATIYIRKGYNFKINGSGSGLSLSGTINVGPTTGSYKNNSVLVASGDYQIHFNFSIVCIVEGTMITLADGTQKAVEDLQIGDNLLVFNHYTGKYDVKPLVVNAHANEEARLHDVLNVRFSNGVLWRIAGTHGLFDCTLNKYVMISKENIDEYVGHEFYYSNGESGDKVTLTDYFVTKETVKVFSPATLDFANYFANGLLNAPPLPNTYTAGQMNYFEFDENMKVDEEKMQADIEKYGLYTYEDFKEYIPEEVFNALPFKYFKISVGKGLMTWEDIIATIALILESA